MTTRRSLTRTLCTLLACLWVSAAQAAPASAHVAPIEIAAFASEAHEDASETQVAQAEAPAPSAPAIAHAAYVLSEPEPEPEQEARARTRRVYIQHCALLL